MALLVRSGVEHAKMDSIWRWSFSAHRGSSMSRAAQLELASLCLRDPQSSPVLLTGAVSERLLPLAPFLLQASANSFPGLTGCGACGLRFSRPYATA